MTDAPAPSDALVPTVHARGDERLDAVVDLVAALARPRPLADVLDEVPQRVAAVFGSEVSSLYLREGDDLVMRGNVGFASGALGEVRLRVGEGLVGLTVECMRPVSAAVASTHARFRAFSMLGEDRFPAFLAVPVPGPAGPAGALVVQRRAGAYEPRDIELLAALAGAIAPLVERARIVAGAAATRSPNNASGARRVTIPGRAIVAGRAIGILAAVRRPSQRAGAPEARPSSKQQMRTLEDAIAGCDATLDAHIRAGARRGDDLSFLTLYRTMLEDGRLRERTHELARARGLGAALAQVAREATRAARLTSEPVLTERAMELSELCDALRVMVTPEGTAGIPKGAVWVAESMTVFELLLAARARPAALVLSGAASPGRARTLVTLVGVPAVAEVAGIYNWSGDGDVALVDGDHGLVRVNPSRRERDEARVERGHVGDDVGHE